MPPSSVGCLKHACSQGFISSHLMQLWMRWGKQCSAPAQLAVSDEMTCCPHFSRGWHADPHSHSSALLCLSLFWLPPSILQCFCCCLSSTLRLNFPGNKQISDTLSRSGRHHNCCALLCPMLLRMPASILKGFLCGDSPHSCRIRLPSACALL